MNLPLLRATTITSALLLVSCVVACATGRGISSPPEFAGTPSSTGCDGWFEIGGTFSRRNDVRYELRNRSTGPACLAKRVTVLFESRLPPSVFRVSTPSGWLAKDVPCENDEGVCGIEWHSQVGVGPGQALGGFGLAYDSRMGVRPKVWIIDLGRRRVKKPIGTVGGIAHVLTRLTG